MKTLPLLILCALLGLTTGVSAANDPADEKAVMATLEAMAKATIAKDVATLDKIYGEDITYSHSTAMLENKASVMKGLQGTGQTEYLKFISPHIRIYGDVALVRTEIDFRTGQPGKMSDNHLNILYALVKRPQGPHGWQVVARQTTRLPPPAPAK